MTRLLACAGAFLVALVLAGCEVERDPGVTEPDVTEPTHDPHGQ